MPKNPQSAKLQATRPPFINGFPRVSVVIPSYNRRDTLPRALASVQAQTLRPCEIIVVDDGSTDGTVDWLHRMMPEVIVVENNSRAGAPYARNRGVEKAQGDYVAFLDSDDVFLPEKLERQMTAMQASSAIFSTCAFGTTRRRNYCTCTPKPDEIFRRNCLGGTTGLVAQRTVLLAEPFDPNLTAAQDWELYLRLFRHGTVAHVPDVLYIYQDMAADRITRHARRRFLGHAALWRRHIRDRVDLGWSVHMCHRASLHMLASDARGYKVSAWSWGLLYRLLLR